jgi:hypothetical protein
MMFFDPMYLWFAAPGMILALWASYKTKSTFKRYAKVGASSGLTGAQAARRLLDGQNLQDVEIQRVQGFLSDHYDPRHRVLRLSPPVHDSQSLAAIGVACHEAGHALQHAHNYLPLNLRSALVPITSVSTQFSYFVLIAGAMLQSFAQRPGGFGAQLVNIGLAMFAVAVLFSLVTLPVEWNASARAKKLMVQSGIVSPREQDGAAAVLNAAFLTYVAALVSSLMTFLYFFLRFTDRR